MLAMASPASVHVFLSLYDHYTMMKMNTLNFNQTFQVYMNEMFGSDTA